VDLDSPGIDGARRFTVNTQQADQVSANLAFVTPLFAFGGVVGRIVVFAVRPAIRDFSLRRRVQKLEFGLAQLAKAGLSQSLKINDLLPGSLSHFRHLF